MAADEIFSKSHPFHFPVDARLYAAHICQDAVLAEKLGNLFQIGVVVGHRGAQENVAAAPEAVVNVCGRHVYDRLLGGQRQSLLVLVKSCDSVVGIVLADGFCDGAADESQPDKSDFLFLIHDLLSSSL